MPLDHRIQGHFLLKGASPLGAFEDAIERLRNPGEQGIPETIYDDLSGIYVSDLSIRDAKVNEQGEALKAANEEIARLKSKNYDLLMATSASNAGSETVEGGNGSDNDESPSGIDDLFEKD
jgi:hypothetical protein